MGQDNDMIGIQLPDGSILQDLRFVGPRGTIFACHRDETAVVVEIAKKSGMDAAKLQLDLDDAVQILKGFSAAYGEITGNAQDDHEVDPVQPVNVRMLRALAAFLARTRSEATANVQ